MTWQSPLHFPLFILFRLLSCQLHRIYLKMRSRFALQCSGLHFSWWPRTENNHARIFRLPFLFHAYRVSQQKSKVKTLDRTWRDSIPPPRKCRFSFTRSCVCPRYLLDLRAENAKARTVANSRQLESRRECKLLRNFAEIVRHVNRARANRRGRGDAWVVRKIYNF